jgi:hypothetical protein
MIMSRTMSFTRMSWQLFKTSNPLRAWYMDLICVPWYMNWWH